MDLGARTGGGASRAVAPPRGGATPWLAKGRGSLAGWELPLANPRRCRTSPRRGGGVLDPPLGEPKFLAAPPRPPSCLRPDSRGGRGGDQAGSGCAAAVLPAQVGECGPGRVNALLKGRPESRAQERRGRLKGRGKAPLGGPGGGHPGASLEHARGVAFRAAGGRLGAAGGRRAREDPLGGSGAALQPLAADLCGTASSPWTGGSTRCLERGSRPQIPSLPGIATCPPQLVLDQMFLKGPVTRLALFSACRSNENPTRG